MPAGSCDCHAHVFGPQTRFPYVANAGYIPRDATPEQYARMLTTIGCERAVLVQPSVYGTDNSCMVAALRSGRIGGAALDVFTHEPLDRASPYWDLPNVIVTPHTSGAMADYWTPLVALFSENLRRFERGERLLNVVDKEAGY